MDETSPEYQDCSRAVTEKEALHNLVSAVILNGVLEYRRQLIANLVGDEGAYYIQKTSLMDELENFFTIIGFDLYKRLPDKVIAFRNKVDAMNPNKDDYFICPICGGRVTSKVYKIRAIKDAQERRYSCDSCLIKMARPIMKKKGK